MTCRNDQSATEEMASRSATHAGAGSRPRADRPPPGWSYYLPASIAALAGCALTLALYPAGPAFPLDDAYIVAHNAMVLREGVDRNYAGTPALTGATSLVHLTAVTLLSMAAPVLYALQASLWIGVLLYALGLAHLARVHGIPPGVALLFVAAGLLVGRTPHHLMNGLETGLAMAAITWALACAVEDRQRPLWLICGTLPFVRPELALLGAGLAMLPVLQAYRREGSWAAIRTLASAVRFGLLAALPWLVWSYLQTGALVPSTVSAKRAWFAEAHLPVVLKTLSVATATGEYLQSIGVAAAGLVVLACTSVGRLGLAFVVLFLTAYCIHLPGALAHNEHRYLYVLTPLLLYGLASLWTLRAGRLTMVAAVALGSLVLQTTIAAPAYWDEHVRIRTASRDELRGVADWCRSNLPPEAKILVHDAGHLAFATDFRLVDMVGLKTPASVPVHQALTEPTRGTGRAEAVARIAAQSGASHIVVLDVWDGIFGITPGLQAAGWSMLPLRRDGAYRVWALSPDRSRDNHASPAYSPRAYQPTSESSGAVRRLRSTIQ